MIALLSTALAFAASCLNDVLQGGHSIANDCVRIVVIGESSASHPSARG